MATFSAIRSGLKTRLETISGLMVYDYVPDFIDPPTVLIAPFNTLNFDSTMQRGSDTYEIPIILYVSKVDAETGQDNLDSFLAM